MIRHLLAALLLGTLPAAADDSRPAAGGGGTVTLLPAEVMGFHGTVTGTVVKVDAGRGILTVKVATASGDPQHNKARKPESLAGMAITITPLETKGKDGKTVLDEKAITYIKGAKAGDSVTLAVRTSSKGVVFRLLKVPAAGSK